MKKVFYVMRKYPALTFATQNLKNGAIKLQSQIHALLRGLLDWHLEKVDIFIPDQYGPLYCTDFHWKNKIHKK